MGGGSVGGYCGGVDGVGIGGASGSGAGVKDEVVVVAVVVDQLKSSQTI